MEAFMVEDIVRTLGYATLGSRLKRIGEKLQSQTQELAISLVGEDLPTPYNPVLAALDLHGPMSIGDLAKSLGQSQPGITRMIKKMKSAGLVEPRPDQTDKRVSTIELTADGSKLVEKLKKQHWPAVTLAVEDACRELHGSFLEQLSQLEQTLSELALADRHPPPPFPDWDTMRKSGESE